ncbi:MAG: DUF1700 domain-containing protein [Lachnospiraceae bacterium]|nr:DUF1700 domain-containing protein [Lachnospiraceae bacterium]
MTQREFSDILRKALNGQVPPYVVSENLDYYDSYISEQMGRGRTEEEILDELGDPRLLARTIIDAEGPSGRKKNRRRTVEYENIYENVETQVPGREPSHINKWVVFGILFLILFALCTVLFFTFKTAFSLLFSFHGVWVWAIVLIIIYSLSRRK